MKKLPGIKDTAKIFAGVDVTQQPIPYYLLATIIWEVFQQNILEKF